ncbi:gamma-glutamyltransferase family protein [Cuniculiplasma sp. SKW4]|uniref:gamma-glutamyltransferase family protein n=1 Tax=Cuniculiplasma sp. SKW4 TaxID=3400171 RepID=UPI003FCF0C62
MSLDTFRPEVYSKSHIVASSSILSSLSGNRILNDGGNVADAAISTSAVLCVVQNNLCGLGGDGFILGRVKDHIFVINGSGKSSHNVSIDYYKNLGFESIPRHGEMSAINVPGLVKSWIDLWKNYGSMDFKDLLRDAIYYAEEGFPVTLNYVDSIKRSIPYSKDREWLATYKYGEIKPGDIFRQGNLGKTLRAISEDPDSFYNGYLADKIIEGFADKNIIMDDYDLKNHRNLIQEPMKLNYGDCTIYETPPNSQGSTVLAWLKLYQDSGANDLTEFYRSGLEAMEFRRNFIGDPERYSLDNDTIISGKWRRKDERVGSFREKDDGDTTYFTVGDKNGEIISMIQSNYLGFGSLVMPTGTGFTLQNRGSYFSLDPHSRNSLEPEKRTFHTLSASIGLKDRNPFFSLGTMGGDIQPQVHALLIDHITNNIKAQKSIELPRAVFPGTIYEQNDTLYYERGFKGVNRLKDLFKNVKELEYGDHLFGHSQVLVYLDSGVINGGADLRGDGFAIPGV